MTKIKSKISDIDDETFIEIIKTSTSCADAMRKLGYVCTTGNASIVVHRRISELNIDITHWADNTRNAHAAQEIPLEDYFIKGTIVRTTSSLKRKVLKNKICCYRCAICGNTGEWNGKTLVLQLHHIDGDRTNNSPSNLQFLCPNCHSQTSNYAGRNSYD